MEIVRTVLSSDGKTVKYLQKGTDGFVVETTYVDYLNKHIICFSSQVGCAVGCRFCVSGLRPIKKRHVRSLDVKELIEQCTNIVARRNLQLAEKPILFSCMGEGEPFLNFQNVVLALRQLGRCYPASRLAVSTSGIKPELIRRLARIIFPVPLKLQVSLHGPSDEIRSMIIPTSRPITDIVNAVRYYNETCGRLVEWNYVLMKDINDSRECAIETARLLGPGCHVKFNFLNPVVNSPFTASEQARLSEFRKILEYHGLTTEYYETDGTDIAAACGQLSYKYLV